MTTKLKILTSGIVCSLFVAGSAMAITLGPEYELIDPVPLVGQPTYTPGNDLGYYIWTDDLERTSWHLRWSGDAITTGVNTIFTGGIVLENNEFTSTPSEYLFETHYSIYDSSWVVTTESHGFAGLVNLHEDGLDFTITNNDYPSFVGFDIFMNGDQEIGNNIFFGADNVTAASLSTDGDFKIAAPVPEPTTMLLFGSGLIGLAGISRRRTSKK